MTLLLGLARVKSEVKKYLHGKDILMWSPSGGKFQKIYGKFLYLFSEKGLQLFKSEKPVTVIVLSTYICIRGEMKPSNLRRFFNLQSFLDFKDSATTIKGYITDI